MSATEVEVGQRWQDCDTRSPYFVTVLAIRGEGVFREVQIQRPSRRTWVNYGRFMQAFRLTPTPETP